MFSSNTVKQISIKIADWHFCLTVIKKESCLISIKLLKAKFSNCSQLQTSLCTRCVVGAWQWNGSPLNHFLTSRLCLGYSPVYWDMKIHIKNKLKTNFQYKRVNPQALGRARTHRQNQRAGETFASSEGGDLPGPSPDVVDDRILKPGDPGETHTLSPHTITLSNRQTEVWWGEGTWSGDLQWELCPSGSLRSCWIR